MEGHTSMLEKWEGRSEIIAQMVSEEVVISGGSRIFRKGGHIDAKYPRACVRKFFLPGFGPF